MQGGGGESMLSVALGVAIGVTFVFMLFSLFLSTVLEAISSLFKLRGRALRVTIAGLIGDPDFKPRFGGFGLLDKLFGFNDRRAPDAGAPRELVADPVDADAPELHEAPTESLDGDHVAPAPLSFPAVFCHPLVGGVDVGSKPSYVSAQNFSTALLYALRSDGSSVGRSLDQVAQRIAALPDGQLRKALQTALMEARGDLDAFKLGVERWYEHAVDRLAGYYKRFSQAALFALGLSLAATFNIDAVAIAKQLYVDPVMRQALEQQAVAYLANPPQPATAAAATAPGASAPETAEDFKRKVEAVKAARAQLLDAVPFVTGAPRPDSPGAFGAALVGWVITALAGMLGAPFWFELLQKFVSLRGAGPKPQRPAPAPDAPTVPRSRQDEENVQ